MTLDFDIDSYSIDDLLKIFNFTSDQIPSEFNIKSKSEEFIQEYQDKLNLEMVEFIKSAREKLLMNYWPDMKSDNYQFDNNKVIGQWYQNEAPRQNNLLQENKTTDRKQKIQTFDSVSRFPMNRENLGVSETYSVPVRQGTMNPNLKNTTSRLVSIDSQYRPNILPPNGGLPEYGTPAFNTDYTFDLSDPLREVISLKLYSIEIPTSFYTFDKLSGNTSFYIEEPGNPSSRSQLIIPDGNYSIDELLFNISSVISSFSNYDVSFNKNNNTNKITLINNSSPLTIIWYTLLNPSVDSSGNLGCSGTQYYNSNLGWNLGFRLQPDDLGQVSITLNTNEKIEADAPYDIKGPRYLILVLDDYNNQNK